MLMMLYMNLMEKNSVVKGLLLNMLGLDLEVGEVEGDILIALVVADLEMIDVMLHL